MKSSKNLLEELKILPYFSKSTIYQFGKQLRLTESTIDTYISRYLKYKEIFQLKNALYTSTDFLNNNKSDISYLYYLGNILRKPSYVSSWTALQYYNLTTEVIHTITSITLKVTRDYTTKAGSYTYQSIKKELFTDFSMISGKFDFFIASPAKALFDLLYFKTHQFRGIKLDEINSLIEELRIDIDEMKSEELTKFNKMIKKYLDHE